MTDAQRERYIRKKGVTRHIILIRHGQYDETYKVSVQSEDSIADVNHLFQQNTNVH